MGYFAVTPKLELDIILGGFALFIVGVQILGDGLTEAAGTKINYYIEKYTSNLFMAILVGTVISAIMHSSTAATVISISLVRAGLMTLEQAIGISIGANIGTTMTSIMIGLDVSEYGYWIVFIGGMILIFSNNKLWKTWGNVLFGLGILFVGLEMMSSKLLVIQEFDVFNNFMYSLKDHPWLALFGSTAATAVIQSSTAVVGITQKLFLTGEMDMIVVSAFVFGSNVGTTLTAILASLGGSISTKRAGYFHALYNVAGALIGMVFIVPYSNMITWMNDLINGAPEMAVALNHLVFNVLSMVFVIPFVPGLIKVLSILIPGEDRIRSREKIEPLDENLIDVFPEGALQLVKNTTIKMSELVLESIESSQNYLHSRNEEDFQDVMQIESMVNQIDTNVVAYLLKIAKSGIQNEENAEMYTRYLEVVKNYERMSDLSTNLVEFYQTIFEVDESFSEEAMEDLDTMYQLLINMVERSANIFEHEDFSRYDSLIKDEDYLDMIEAKYKEKHYRRMAEGICDTKVASSLFVDILGTLERIGDHSANVARNVFSVVKYHEEDQ